MRQAFRHTGVLMMSAVVALGLLGAGFALWFQVLTFNATVQTGQLQVQASEHGSSPIVCIKGQNGDANNTAPNTAGDCEQYGDYQAPAPGKDVTTCAFSVGSTNENNDTWNLTVGNAFPYSGCQYTADVTNTGTVPVHLDLTAQMSSVTGDTAQIHFAQSNADCQITLPTGGPFPAPFPGSGGENQYSSRFTQGANGHWNFQLHPGESIACTYRLWLEQVAAEGSTYQLHASLIARQYNEDQAPLPVATTQVISAIMGFSDTGWGGWSCPAAYPHIVSATTTLTSTLNSLAWKTGASVGSYSFPTTPFGYTYGASEEGWVVQNNGGQHAGGDTITLTCSQ